MIGRNNSQNNDNQRLSYEYGAVKKGTFLTSHSKMLAIIEKGTFPFSITHNTYKVLLTVPIINYTLVYNLLKTEGSKN